MPINSVTQNYKDINVDQFELCIVTGLSKKQIMQAFSLSYDAIDDWCAETYNASFELTYHRIKALAQVEFLKAMNDLAYRGNPSAINIIREFLNGQNKDTNVNIKFVSNVPKEEVNQDDEI